MPKAYVLSNGRIHVGFDQFSQVYDFYFPYVGLENQMGKNYVHKLGIFVDSKMHWFDNGEWDIKHGLSKDYNIGCSKLVNKNIGIEVSIKDSVYNEKDILIRQIKIKNNFESSREVKLFFNQQFEMYESYRGDTAYFDPTQNVIIHYKGRRIFLVNAINAKDLKQFSEYSIGLLGIEGKEGTYKDAEDGKLESNPVEHGLVDSVIGLEFVIDANSTAESYYWLIVGKLQSEVLEMNSYINEKKPWYLMTTSKNYWRAWIKKQNFSFYGLNEEVVDLFKKSLFVLRSHVDNTGSIIASGDSDLLKYGRDTYSYMWPRDGAFVTMALDNAGYHGITKAFFEFCNDVISPEGFFLHKYRSDKSFGSSWHPWIREGKPSLPIQEDETALVLWALWHHYTKTKDIEFIELVYNSLIKKIANFLVSYFDPETMLPMPSYDLWEEKYGVHTFTVASVYGALTSAAKFAEILGKLESRDLYLDRANKISEGIVQKLFSHNEKYFYKSINNVNSEIVHDKTLDISSFFGLLHFGVLKPENEMMQSTLSAIQKDLVIKNAIGGIARYKNDNYYRVSNENGNPWVITTLWVAQYYIKKAQKFEELEPVLNYLNWVKKYSTSGGMIAEQFNPITGEPISATPLAWSHAEFVSTVIYYMQKIEQLGICDVCYPVE